ncbi:MAG: type II secretion system major pseudopilin GspG [Bryobacterales bacterium]|nr:type II secretion system major pseudopilin GspG [Bryobacterales bacterium]
MTFATTQKRQPRRARAAGQAGITLIEMLVVMTIIALFATLVGPRLLSQGDKARVTKARADIAGLKTALNMYKLDTGVFPTTEQGLKALEVAPQGLKNWQGPYLSEELVMDPWGNPYDYRFPGQRGNEPDIISYGADGVPGGEELNADIVSWKAN